MAMRNSLKVLAVTSLLAGCASAPLAPRVAVMPAPGKSFEQFVAEERLCRQWAEQSVGLSAMYVCQGQPAAGRLLPAAGGELSASATALGAGGADRHHAAAAGFAATAASRPEKIAGVASPARAREDHAGERRGKALTYNANSSATPELVAVACSFLLSGSTTIPRRWPCASRWRSTPTNFNMPWPT